MCTFFCVFAPAPRIFCACIITFFSLLYVVSAHFNHFLLHVISAHCNNFLAASRFSLHLHIFSVLVYICAPAQLVVCAYAHLSPCSTCFLHILKILTLLHVLFLHIFSLLHFFPERIIFTVARAFSQFAHTFQAMSMFYYASRVSCPMLHVFSAHCTYFLLIHPLSEHWNVCLTVFSAFGILSANEHIFCANACFSKCFLSSFSKLLR